MHIVHDSPDALILKERAIVLRAVGAALCVAGAVTIVIGVNTHGLSLSAPLIIGAILGTLGALFAFLPATHTFAFSRAERRLIVVRQRIGRTTREEYPLRDVADAVVDASTSSEGGSTWRVVVRLADGQVIPVTSYYTSGYESKRRAADRIREFLHRAGDRIPDAPRIAGAISSPYASSLTSARQKLAAIALLAAVGLLFGGIGGTIMLREHRRLTTWLPTKATVLSKDIDEQSDSDGSTYSPVVVYRYTVNDREYTSSRVLPVRESRSGGWAHRIVAQYDVGARYTAWYDPANPADAYLRRSRGVVAPIFAAIGALLIVPAVFLRRRA